jgi:hypothetical protein
VFITTDDRELLEERTFGVISIACLSASTVEYSVKGCNVLVTLLFLKMGVIKVYTNFIFIIFSFHIEVLKAVQ